MRKIFLILLTMFVVSTLNAKIPDPCEGTNTGVDCTPGTNSDINPGTGINNDAGTDILEQTTPTDPGTIPNHNSNTEQNGGTESKSGTTDN